MGINGAKLDAPEADRFSGYINASLGQQIFYIMITQVEAIVEPHSVGDYIWRESVSFVDIHGPILSIWPG